MVLAYPQAVSSQNLARFERPRNNTWKFSEHQWKGCRDMRIHAIQTGWVQVRCNQIAARKEDGFRRLRTIVDREWAPPVPIYAWLVEHPEGLLLVDTGETARVSDPGHHPGWHPYFRRSVRFAVRRDEEIDAQLDALGLDAADVRWVVLTHLHTDHAGGVRHFPKAEVIVDSTEWRAAQGPLGVLGGYLPQHWPNALNPRHARFTDGPWGAFERSMRLTSADDVHILPTPGHTSGHLSVSVSLPEFEVVLAGDLSYTQEALLSDRLDGVAPDARLAHRTLHTMRRHVGLRPTIYLPSHDPNSAIRLARLGFVEAAGLIQTSFTSGGGAGAS